ncbi:hypothetical protein ACA910_006658 [Epithemia clementina (nom. ined.)]
MTTLSAANNDKNEAGEEDPYIWLEDVESDESMEFAKRNNEACLNALGNPETTTTGTYQRILNVLESTDRIPYVSLFGHTDDGQGILFNFWKDADNPKGLWRQTTMESYKTAEPTWHTVLNVDELAQKDGIGWVWKESTPLPRARDEVGTGKRVERALLKLSRGGSDAVHVKEFDLVQGDFVAESDQPFYLPEAKSRVSYKSRNVLLVGTDMGPDSLTDSGYPRTVREWVRGTKLEDAPVIFEGEKGDISVSCYISDERTWGGGIYEFRVRSITFYTSKYWMRPIQPEHCLAPNDPARVNTAEPQEFVELDIQEDASVSLLGNLMFFSLRSDWEPVARGKTYPKGSLIYTTTQDFIDKGAAGCVYDVLFEPTERTAYEYYTATKNYLILATMENVKSKLEFYKIGDNGTTLTLLKSASSVAQIRDCNASPIDSYSGSDEFWFTTSSFLLPSSLFLADASKMELGDQQQESQDSAVGLGDPFIVEKLKQLPPKFDASGLTVEQRTATSADGTEIPYFIVMNEDTALNGKNPTLLYGYGGFEVSLGPNYIATTGLAWLERGGVFVEANIRGGGEFGPSWHQAAVKKLKQKSYQDFIAVAEHLIASKICQPKTLAIRGGSNGGLLMGNMYTMRPDLFGAIHSAVPLFDMKRYHLLLAGASWMAEYGNPDTDDWEDFLKDISPYHNIKADVEYPPLLVTTSTRDDRVHPAHARKLVKKLQDINPKSPVYYYENIEGGHGGAADAKQSAFMTALAHDFLFATLTKNAESL